MTGSWCLSPRVHHCLCQGQCSHVLRIAKATEGKEVSPHGSCKIDGALTSDSITVTPDSDPSGVMQENQEEPVTP